VFSRAAAEQDELAQEKYKPHRALVGVQPSSELVQLSDSHGSRQRSLRQHRRELEGLNPGKFRRGGRGTPTHAIPCSPSRLERFGGRATGCDLYRAATLKCGNSGRLLPRRGARRGSRQRGGQARGSGNSSARSGGARVAPAGGLVRSEHRPLDWGQTRQTELLAGVCTGCSQRRPVIAMCPPRSAPHTV